MAHQTVLFWTVLCCSYIHATTDNKTAIRYNVRITERGTTFKESIEIINQDTVVYHVPSHNDVDQSDVLIDYKEKLSVTRIPRLKECQVEEMTEDESSPQMVKYDIVKFKLFYKEKVKHVRTIHRTMIKSREFENASAVVLEFCGTFPMFKMNTINVVDSDNIIKGHSIRKRSSVRTHYLKQLSEYVDSVHGDSRPEPPTDDEGDDDDDSDSGSGSGSGSGYVPLHVMSAQEYKDISMGHCGSLNSYDMKNCIASPLEQWNRTAVKVGSSCVYKVKCRSAKVNNGQYIKGDCIEEHHSATEVCYKLSCKQPSQA